MGIFSKFNVRHNIITLQLLEQGVSVFSNHFSKHIITIVISKIIDIATTVDLIETHA